MNQHLIFLPLLVQVGLTIWAFIRLSAVKRAAVARGDVDESRRGIDEDAWPDDVRLVNNNIHNQFELPVLFYVLVLSLYVLQAAGWLPQLLAWLFVLSRIGHFHIHTVGNNVPLRRRVFMFGAVTVMLMALVCLYAIFL